jgi:hypothetical protein
MSIKYSALAAFTTSNVLKFSNKLKPSKGFVEVFCKEVRGLRNNEDSTNMTKLAQPSFQKFLLEDSPPAQLIVFLFKYLATCSSISFDFDSTSAKLESFFRSTVPIGKCLGFELKVEELKFIVKTMTEMDIFWEVVNLCREDATGIKSGESNIRVDASDDESVVKKQKGDESNGSIIRAVQVNDNSSSSSHPPLSVCSSVSTTRAFAGKIYERETNSALNCYDDENMAEGKPIDMCSFYDCFSKAGRNQCNQCSATSRIQLKARFCGKHSNHFGSYGHFYHFQKYGLWIDILNRSPSLMSAFKVNKDPGAVERLAFQLHRWRVNPSSFFNGLDSVQDIADEVLRQLASFENDEKTEKG